jgi:phosphoribosyl 1,2-cyclic phosphodiesterase
MKVFCPLASGSKGNSIFIGGNTTKILIDAGISCLQIEKRLGSLDVSIDDIDAIVITHEHTDHIAGLKVLLGKKNIPVICNAETAKGIYGNLGIKPSFKIFITGETFELGEMTISPISIQHDTLDPVAFSVVIEDVKIGVCTDIGFVTTVVKQALTGCHYLYVEANHQEEMVMASPRSYVYKRRVMGRQGHLSNNQCAELITEINHHSLKHIYLAHLSDECNSQKLAIDIITKALQKVERGATTVSIAHQRERSQPIFF